jgi:CSLREA domain-containing protein
MRGITLGLLAATRGLAPLVGAMLLLGLALVVGMQKPAHAVSTTFTVTSTADPGDGECDSACTLRDAILAANANDNLSEQDRINFSVAGEGVKTISPGSPLPPIEEPVIIDGYTQPGSSANTLARGTNAKLLVELDGSIAGSSANGLQVSASNVVVRGLVINRFGDNGILTGGSGIKIEGNFIGTDAAGQANLGSGDDGVQTSGDNTTVGGTSPEARNLISGNDGDGVFVFATRGNKVLGNLIGTRKDGTRRLGNGDDGVDITDSVNNVVGGTTPDAANIIAFNDANGVNIDDLEAESDGSATNRILSSSIFSNTGLGIDLNNDGPTPNDPGDLDTGANGLQNKPLLASATNSTTTTIKGKLSSTPEQSFVVSFFSNPSGENEGKTFLGQRRVTTNSEGKGTFAFSPKRKVGVGKAITATATGSEGTSEFSGARVVE